MQIRKLLLLLFLLSLSFSQSFSSLIQGEETSGEFAIVSYWKPLTIALLLLTVLLVAVARAIGQAFDFADLKAWANVELVQAIGTAFIIIAFIAILSFFDVLFPAIINGAGAPVVCNPSDTVSCAHDIAGEYNDELIEIAEKDVEELLQKAYNEGKTASLRTGVNAHQRLLLQTAISFSPYAQKILHIERYSEVIEEYNGILSSLYAQRFFLTEICYKIGPVLLLAGLLLRSFFMTRKLGGLLIAIAIGLMLVFPLMYVFDWVTLSVTIYGDATFASIDTIVCPESCKKEIPIAYKENDFSRGYTYEEIDEQVQNGEYFVFGQVYDIDNMDEFIAELYSPMIIADSEGVRLLPCNKTISSSIPSGECPIECMYVPYPDNKQECTNEETKAICQNIVSGCKISLFLEEEELPEYMQEQLYMCPYECKVIPPLKSDCSGLWLYETCDSDDVCASDRWEEDDDQRWAAEDWCEEAYAEFAGRDIVPAIDPFCENSPTGIWWNWDENNYCDGESDVLDCSEALHVRCCVDDSESSCAKVSNSCKVRYYEIDEDGNRVLLDAERPESCSEEDWERAQTCPVSLEDPYENCVYIIPEDTERCSGCLFVNTGFTYDPAIAIDCGTMCGTNKESATTISTGAFASASSNGLYGTMETRNVSSLFVPAFILPLLNILVTVMFIQTFSPLLGGDVEIPGLSKIL